MLVVAVSEEDRDGRRSYVLLASEALPPLALRGLPRGGGTAAAAATAANQDADVLLAVAVTARVLALVMVVVMVVVVFLAYGRRCRWHHIRRQADVNLSR